MELERCTIGTWLLGYVSRMLGAAAAGRRSTVVGLSPSTVRSSNWSTPVTVARRSATERPHVLVLTDDVDLSDFLTDGLTLGGFWTSTIASGLQALEVFRLRGFDLVLVDATLSGLGPLEVIRRLRLPAEDGAPRADVPIIVIAGSESEMSSATATSAGADGILYPPIELEVLIPHLFGLVDEWRAAHPGRPWADEAAQGQSQADSTHT